MWASPSPLFAKSYSVRSIEIDATVLPSGVVEVKERLTYRFSGSFSFVYRDIPTRRGEKLSSVIVC